MKLIDKMDPTARKLIIELNEDEKFLERLNKKGLLESSDLVKIGHELKRQSWWDDDPFVWQWIDIDEKTEATELGDNFVVTRNKKTKRIMELMLAEGSLI